MTILQSMVLEDAYHGHDRHLTWNYIQICSRNHTLWGITISLYQHVSGWQQETGTGPRRNPRDYRENMQTPQAELRSYSNMR